MQFTGTFGKLPEILVQLLPALLLKNTLLPLLYPEKVAHTRFELELSTAIPVSDAEVRGKPVLMVVHEGAASLQLSDLRMLVKVPAYNLLVLLLLSLYWRRVLWR